MIRCLVIVAALACAVVCCGRADAMTPAEAEARAALALSATKPKPAPEKPKPTGSAPATELWLINGVYYVVPVGTRPTGPLQPGECTPGKG